MDYSLLKVSNGAGDAVLMHVNAARLVGATTISVDAVVNVPDKFIATYGTLDSNGYISEASKREIIGHLSGGDIIIDEFLPGSTDNGNVGGQVVVIRPNTNWANRLVELAQVSHNNDGTLNAAALERIYPIGCIYTEVTGANPATTFGFGEWAAFGEGRVLVGKAASGTFATAGAAGGEETHTLTTSEMPSHTHNIGVNDAATGSGFNGVFRTTKVADQALVQASGGGGAHNNLQPYLVVYFWRRTA